MTPHWIRLYHPDSRTVAAHLHAIPHEAATGDKILTLCGQDGVKHPMPVFFLKTLERCRTCERMAEESA